MSEVLKNSGGEKVDASNRVEVLENEAGKFNPEAAKKLKSEQASHLAVLKEKEQPKELSPYEEYRELVKELSADLPDDKGSGINYGKETRVDAILESEVAWRKNSEEMQDRAKTRDNNLKKLEEEYSQKGFFGKLFGKRKFEKQRDAIMGAYDDGYRKNKIFNERMQNDLAKAYGDRYEDEKKNNEMRNRQFFGYDDPERAAKVERAIELRRSFGDTREWQKESKTSGHMIRDLTIERQRKQEFVSR